MNDPSPAKFDLRKWLDGLGMGAYADAFESQDLNLETLLELTQDDLKECGVTSLGHRKALQLAIQALKNNAGNPETGPSPEKSPAEAGILPPLDKFPDNDAGQKSTGAPAITGKPTETVKSPPAPAALMTGGIPDATAPIQPPGNPPVALPEPVASKEKEEKPPILKRFLNAYRKASGGSLLLSIAIHAVILIIGTYLVVSQIVEERKISFGGGEAGPKQEAEHKVKRKTTTAPAPTKRITTTSSIANVALPDMPNIPTNMGPAIAGAMGAGGFGASGGLGGGGSGGGSGSGKGSGFSKITFFGLRGGKNDNLMKGMFYDLKQTKDKKPTEIASNPSAYWSAVKDFVGRQNWSPEVLEKYYHPDTALYSPRVFVPVGVSTEAPKAFGVERDVKDDRWVVHYKGRMRATKDGMFRFVGCGDNILVVRLNKRNFFDGSMTNRRGGLINPALTSITKQPPETLGNACAAGWELGASEWFQASRGQTFDIEVLIGDCGGFFSAFLLIEEKGATYAKRKEGGKAYPVFQVDSSRMPPLSSPANLKAFNPDVAAPVTLFEGVPSGL